jgi:hypothetical protein
MKLKADETASVTLSTCPNITSCRTYEIITSYLFSMHVSVFRNNSRIRNRLKILRRIWQEYFLELYKECSLSLDIISTAGLCLSRATNQFSLVLVQCEIFKLLRLDFYDRKYSPSLDFYDRKYSPSLDFYDRKYSPSLDFYDRKYSASLHFYDRKYSPSLDFYDRKYSPSLDFYDRKYSASLDFYDKKYSASLDFYDRKYSPSLDFYDRKYSPSLDFYDKKYSASLDFYDRKYSASLDFYDRKYSPSLDFYDTKYSPSQNRPPGVDRYWKKHQKALFILFVSYFLLFKIFPVGSIVWSREPHTVQHHIHCYLGQYWTWKHEYVSGSWGLS